MLWTAPPRHESAIEVGAVSTSHDSEEPEHANNYDRRSRYREVSVSGSWRRCRWQCSCSPSAQATLCSDVLSEGGAPCFASCAARNRRPVGYTGATLLAHAMAEVEDELLTAAEFAVLAAIVEINESGQLGLLDALCRKNEIARDRRKERGLA